MAQPFIGEIKLFAGQFQISGWAYCNGQLLSISDYEPLYTLIGTTYGGDGVNTFALPNLQSRIPLHQGTGPGLTTRAIGEASGVENASVAVNQLPAHTHQTFALTNTATASSPANMLPAAPAEPALLYVSGSSTGNTDVAPNPSAISSTGNSVAHNNIMPVLAMNYLIALYGVFPQQS